MGRLTRVWGHATGMLYTTVPKGVRLFLGLTGEDTLAWVAHDKIAVVTKAPAPSEGYALTAQSKGTTLITTVPSFVRDELGIKERNSIEWEMKTKGDERFVEVRRG